MVAKKKSDAAQEVVTAAERLMDIPGVSPEELWELTYASDSNHSPGPINGSQSVTKEVMADELISEEDDDYD